MSRNINNPNDNYYIILELNLTPPESNIAVIKQTISDKKKEWNAKRNVPGKGSLYTKLASQTDDMLIVLDARESRDKEAAAAIKIADTKIQTGLAYLINKGYVTTEEIENLAKRSKISKSFIESRVTVEIKTTQKTKKNIKKPEPSPAIMKRVENLLQIVKKENLYDFIVDITKDSTLRVARAKDISNSVKGKIIEYQKKSNSPENTAIKNLCSECQTIFKDDDNKIKYDNYLENNKIKVITEQIDMLNSSGKSLLNESVVLCVITDLGVALCDTDGATQYFKNYCAEKGYAYDLPSEGDLNRTKLCFVCGTPYIDDNKQKRCTNCGEALRIICPNCGKERATDEKACGECGFSLEGMKLIPEMCKNAEEAIAKLELKTAETILQKAEKYWSNHKDVIELKQQLAKVKKTIQAKLDRLNNEIRKNNYYTAKKELLNIKRELPNYSNDILENEINNRIKSAEMLIRKAKLSNNEITIVNHCSKAYVECSDYPEISSLLRRYPVKPISSLYVSSDTVKGYNTLTWQASPSSGLVTYRIVRNENGKPQSPSDGQLVVDEKTCQYIDKDISAGEKYYYCIYSIRAGMFSNPVLSKEVINTKEVQDIAVLAESKSIRVQWNKPENCRSIKVWTIDNNNSMKLLPNIQLGGFTLSSLQNDKTYRFKICTQYYIGNKEISSSGINVSATPTEPPKSVHLTNIKKISDNQYEVQWSVPNKGIVDLYFAKNPRLDFSGSIIDKKKLNENYCIVPVNDKKHTSAIFTINDGVSYITPVVKINNLAVIGDVKRLTQLIPVKNIKHKIYNNKALIEFDWPQNVNKVRCLLRNDHYTHDPTDETATVLEYTRARYDREEKAISFNCVSNTQYYATIFACHEISGELIPSDPVECLIGRNIKNIVSYNITIKKPLLKANYQFQITFTSDKEINLPKMVLVGKKDRFPLRKGDGIRLAEISEKKIIRKYATEMIYLPNVKKGLRLKLFFENDIYYDSFKLNAPQGTSLIIK